MLKRWLLAVSITLAGCSDRPPPKNHCAMNNGGCDPNAECIDLGEIYTCGCKPEYSGDGITCQPLLTVTSPAEGAVINKAAPGLVLSGTVSEVSKLQYAIDNGAAKTLTVSNDSFSETIAVAEGENGVQHTVTFTVTGVESGHQATVKRTYTVDRVAPTCVASVDQKRLVSRTAVLFECSEPMDVASVVDAVSVAPGADVRKLGSADGKTFQFPSGILAPYQIYTASLDAGAMDKAGNPTETKATERFLTEIALPDALVSMPAGGFPFKITVDADGRPALLTGTGTTTEGSHIKAMQWDGKHDWTTTSLPYDEPAYPNPEINTRHTPQDFRANSEVDKVSLTLTNEFEVLTWTNNNNAAVGAIEYLHSGDLSTWTGLRAAAPDLLWDGGLPSFLREYGNASSPSTAVLASLYSFDGVEIIRKQTTGTEWGTPIQIAPGWNVRGIAVSDDDQKVFRVLPSNTPTFGFTDSYPSFYGVQQHMKETPGGYSPAGSAFIAWTEFKSSSSESYSAVYLACSASPSDTSAWNRSRDLTPIPALDRNNNEQLGVTVASLSESTLAIALSSNKNRVFFGTMANTDCSNSPGSITWDNPIAGASSPVVAVAPDGRVWKAWVDNSSKNLMITHRMP